MLLDQAGCQEELTKDTEQEVSCQGAHAEDEAQGLRTMHFVLWLLGLMDIRKCLRERLVLADLHQGGELPTHDANSVHS